MTDQFACRDSNGAEVPEAAGDVCQPVGVVAGLQRVADPREHLANLGRRIETVERLGPQIVGSHDAASVRLTSGTLAANLAMSMDWPQIVEIVDASAQPTSARASRARCRIGGRPANNLLPKELVGYGWA